MQAPWCDVCRRRAGRGAVSDLSRGPAVARSARPSGGAATAASARAAARTSQALWRTAAGIDDATASTRFAGFTAWAEPFRSVIDAHGGPPGMARSAAETTAPTHARARRPDDDRRHGNPPSEAHPPLRGRRSHAGRGRRVAQARHRGRRGRRGAPRHLRGSALLREARPGSDAGRGPRHRGPHLRDLPCCVPDECGPRVRGRRGDRRPTRRSAHSAACCTAGNGSRATRSTCTSSTHPTSLATPAPSSWLATTGCSSNGRSSSRDRKPPRLAGRWPTDPSGDRPGRGLLPRPVQVGDDGDSPRPHRGAGDRRGDRPRRRSVRTARIRARAAPRLTPPPGRLSDERGPDRVDRRSRPRPWRLGIGVRGGPGRMVERPPGEDARR